jgi:small subunit ribosomal protein S1
VESYKERGGEKDHKDHKEHKSSSSSSSSTTLGDLINWKRSEREGE